MSRFRFLVLLFMAGFQTLSAAGSGLENSLNQQYKGHTYTLRQPASERLQQYDSHGNSANPGKNPGNDLSWTIYSRVEIKKITLQEGVVIVEGKRIGLEFDSHKHRLIPVSLGKITLRISTDQSLTSAEEARALFTHVFAFTKDDFLASVPDFWRRALSEQIESYSDDGDRIVLKSQAPLQPLQNQPAPAPDVFHVAKGVTAPRVLYSPDPEFTQAARNAAFSGTATFNVIINKDGRVTEVELVQPLGLGLDEKCDQMIRTWRFEPARRNGEPVAVEVRVEVAFNL